jgi:predicted CopG family antitoxin
MPRGSSEKNVRACISIRFDLHQQLASIAEKEGRSFSNLCAYLLEQALDEWQKDK